MIARFDHRPKLTALLALTTTVLVVVVVTLCTLLITAAPPAVAPTSDSGGSAAHAQSGLGPGSPARDARGSYSSNGIDPIERHAEVVARLGEGSLR